MKKLIQGSSHEVQAKFDEIRSEYSQFKRIAVFFENTNFLATEFTPMTLSVNMILEDTDSNQIHIEGCNCGYGGQGPSATVKLLVGLGINKETAAQLVYHNDGLLFELNEDGDIVKDSIDTSVFFQSNIRDASTHNSINLDANVNVDLLKRKVMLFNPQYHCFRELLRLLTQIKPVSFEYYIGENSPLENYYCVEGLYDLYPHNKRPDFTGLEHVNLIIRGENIEISFLIDRQCEVQVIDAIFMAIKHETLFPKDRFQLKLIQKKSFIDYVREIFRTNQPSESTYNDIVYLD